MKAGVRLLVKREDTNHPTVSGNKWWKLKYNLQHALTTSHRTILTFGGAYSNHIYATAAAADELGLNSIGIIRGEEHHPLNPTLQFATSHGMQIHYVQRATYRKKDSSEFLNDLAVRYGDFLMIPEGGTNVLAVKGCAEFADQELEGAGFDHICLAVGTGGTMAGLITGLKEKTNIIGVPVLKNGEFLYDEIKRLLPNCNQPHTWSLLTKYHLGGYGRTTPELEQFISEMKSVYALPLDQVYTAKVFWALLKEIEAGSFSRGDTIMVIHTGGLQGRTPTG